MSHKTRLSVVSVFAGLQILFNSCTPSKPSLELIHTTELNFPSASAIEFYQNKLYVFGDDAPTLLILSTDYKPIDSISFWQPTTDRIPKEQKHDIESAFIRSYRGELLLYGVGSMSAEKRWGALEYNLKTGVVSPTSFFDTVISFPPIKEVNIEGSCMIGNSVVFANRGNLSNPVNHLIFWDKPQQFTSKPFALPAGKVFTGVSGLYYAPEEDVLFFTASEEETVDAITDGAIGDSYLGLIRKFSQKRHDSILRPDVYLRLADFDQSFQKQKIESVCVEDTATESAILHLAADNDDGTSKLFKIKLNTAW